MIWNYIKKYKTSIIGVLLVWALYQFAISPIRQQNNELKKDIKNRQKQNELISKELKKDSLLLVEKAEKIKKYEIEEQKFKDLKPLIQIKYEKEKTAYYNNDVIERRRIFAKLANE